ncbi:MAG: FAD-binding oxidoreductase [Methanobacteriota archaeon]
MGLLRDWTFIEEAVRIPALRDVVREALIKAVFTRDDRVLPREIIARLTRAPAATVKVKDDAEIRKLVQVFNGSESSVNLGLALEDYHFFRKELGVGKDRDVGLVPKPRVLLTHDWLVPEQRGVQLDFGAYRAIDLEGGHRAVVQVGATWKDAYDAARATGRLVPFVPTVPLDFSIGDGVWGDAPYASYRAEFAEYVTALRSVSAYGHRTRIGFEDVSGEGAGYDLLHAILPFADEFVVPTEVAFRLVPAPAARKTLTYGYEDASKASAALDRLAGSLRTPSWVHVADAGASGLLRPGVPADAITVQLGIGGPAAGDVAREKAYDGVMAGFKAKATDVPNPFDVPAEAYRKAADRLVQGLFVGEVRLPVKALPAFVERAKRLGEQVAARPSLIASLRSSGILSAFPAFESPRERHRVYDLSKGIASAAADVPGATYVSRIAHLWDDSPAFRRRMEILRRLKLEIDTPRVIQPLVTP